MHAKFDSSQDITLRISKSEFLEITKERTEYFYEKVIRATSLEAEANFFLGFSENFFDGAKQLDSKIQLMLPNEKADPYLVNLLPEGVYYLRLHSEYVSRYAGGSKLFIIIEEE